MPTLPKFQSGFILTSAEISGFCDPYSQAPSRKDPPKNEMSYMLIRTIHSILGENKLLGDEGGT